MAEIEKVLIGLTTTKENNFSEWIGQKYVENNNDSGLLIFIIGGKTT